MRLAPALLRSICSDVPLRPSVARLVGSSSLRCTPARAICLGVCSISSTSTSGARTSRSSQLNCDQRRLFSSSAVARDEDRAMEERLLRLKRDFEAQKAAEEAKRKAAEEAKRRVEEEKMRKEKEEKERKARLEKEAEERKARETQEAEKRRQKEAATLVEQGKSQKIAVKVEPEPIEGKSSGRDVPAARSSGLQDAKIEAESSSSAKAKGPSPDHDSTDVSKPVDATVPSPTAAAGNKAPPPPRSSSTSSPPLRKPPSSITAQAAKTFASSRHVWIQNLPSQTENLRFEMTKRFNRYMEHLLRVAATTSHRLNIYTGTDYSGIQALRIAIEGQEQVVRSALKVVDSAKDDYSASFAAQAASQKEVVQLLERKHSWSAVDLERYMALIRSEHTNEQDVQKAKEQLAEKEKALEEARAQLEKNERRLYHEEQIWSDTIRRNSTWVTFGLMGLNIFLLLSSLLIFEPWRRRRLVREIRSALDEKSVPLQAVPVVDQASGSQIVATPKQVDPVLEATVEATTTPVEETLEQIKEDIPDAVNVETITVDTSGSEPVVLDAKPAMIESSPNKLEAISEGNPTPADAATVENQVPPPTPYPSRPYYSTHTSLPSWAPTWSGTWSLYKAYWADLFSDRIITLTKADLTTKALEGAAAGAAFMGLMFVLLYPRGGS